MAKTKISEYSTTNSANTDINSINIDEGCPPSSINNAIREVMVHLKNFQTGASSDPLTVAGAFVSSGGSTFSGTNTFSGTTIFSGTATASTQSTGDNTTKLATTAFVQAALQAMYPVGSVYINATSATNPATLLGFGTWVAFGAGRVMVGLDSSDTAFDTAEETGGSKDAIVVSHTHTATVTDPGHTHTVSDSTNRQMTAPAGGVSGGATNTPAAAPSGTDFVSAKSNTTGISVSNSTTGSSGTNANLQPYIVVRMWKRTA